MTDHQAPPTFAPYLPPPAPRVAPPTAAPPNPWARIAAANDAVAPAPTYTDRKRSKWRLPGFSLIGLLIGAASWFVTGKLIEPESDARQAGVPTISASDPAATPAPPTTFAVQTDAFSFAMPSEPEVEQINEVVLGISVTGTAWEVNSDGVVLSVIAMNFGVTVSEAEVQGAFNSMTAGVVQRSNGTLVSDEWSSTNGLYQRTTVSTFDGGYIFQKGYAQGIWIVAILAVSSKAAPPSWFNDAISSFSFA